MLDEETQVEALSQGFVCDGIDRNIDDPQHSRLEKNFSLVDGNLEKSYRIPENPEDCWLGGKMHHPTYDADL